MPVLIRLHACLDKFACLNWHSLNWHIDKVDNMPVLIGDFDRIGINIMHVLIGMLS